MNKRLKILRKSLNLTQSEFANSIGIKGSSYCDIENGKASITERTIISICSIYNVNRQWLQSGKGDIFVNINENDFLNTFKKLNINSQKFILNYAKLNIEK